MRLSGRAVMVSAAQVEIYARFNGDVDIYQRRGSPQRDVMGDTWNTIEDLRSRLFLISTARASDKFASSTEADLLAWTANEEARRLIRALVDQDVKSQPNR
jgi:hypothetical protein